MCFIDYVVGLSNCYTMNKHKLVELQQIVGENWIAQIRSRNSNKRKIKTRYTIADRKDEFEYLERVIRTIKPIFDRDNDE